MNKAVFKEKWDNYWYYYKIHTFAAVFIAIVLIGTIVSAVKQKDTMLNVMILGQDMNDDKRTAMQDEVSKLLVANPRKQEITISFLPYSGDETDSSSKAVSDKLVVMTAAGDLDVAILDKKDFDLFCKAGMFERLDNLKGLPNLDSAGYKTSSSKTQTDDKEYTYGINVDNCEKLKAAEYYTENKVLAFCVSGKKKELSMKFVKWLLNLK